MRFTILRRNTSDLKSCYIDCCTVWINIACIFNFYPATMSRVLAIKDYTRPDCRYLSFKSGEEIMVYFKLSREREDLWAGSVTLADRTIFKRQQALANSPSTVQSTNLVLHHRHLNHQTKHKTHAHSTHTST
uniref:SH3 domain-containing protein n=1 Tax=Laticauda laticaudata TaxID=8630 RepID=A0A8C5RZG1_LATLA